MREILVLLFHTNNRRSVPDAGDVDAEPRHQSVPAAGVARLAAQQQRPRLAALVPRLQLQLDTVARLGRHGDRLPERTLQVPTRTQKVVAPGRLHCEYRATVAFYIIIYFFLLHRRWPLKYQNWEKMFVVKLFSPRKEGVRLGVQLG